MKRLGLLVIVLLFATLFSPSGAAQASPALVDPPPYDWYLTLDFTASDYDFVAVTDETNTYGEYGADWAASDQNTVYGYYRIVWISRSFGDVFDPADTITHLKWTYSLSADVETETARAQVMPDCCTVLDTNYGVGAQTLEWAGSEPYDWGIGIYILAGQKHDSPPGGSAHITKLEMWGTGPVPDLPEAHPDHVRPVKSTDTIDDHDKGGSPQHVRAPISIPGAKVYSPFAGTVQSVVQQNNGLWDVVITNDTLTAYLWRLSVADVVQGDVVTGGCIIGVVGPALVADTLTLPSGAYGEIEVTIEDGSGDVDWLAWPDSTSNMTCGSRFNQTGCLVNNPRFDSYASGWLTGDGLSVAHADYVDLYQYDWAYQSIQLETPVDYYVTITGASEDTNLPGVLTVTLGDASDTAVLPAGAETTLTVGPLSPTTPDFAPDIYNLRLENLDLQSNGIKVDFACLHTGNLTITPGACYFAHPQAFDSTTEWTLGGTATSSNSLLGNTLTLPAADGTASADIILFGYSDKDADYRIVVDAMVYGPSITHAFSTSDMVDLDATIDTDPSTELGSWTANNLIAPVSYTADFMVPQSDSVTGHFILAASNAQGDAVGATVSRICITPTNGGWPGYDTSVPGVQVTCQACSPPDTIDIFLWLAYLGCIVVNIWFCFASVVLGNIGASIGAILAFLSQTLSWLSAVAGELVGVSGLIGQNFLSQLAALIAASIEAAWLALINTPLGPWLVDLLGMLGVLFGATMALIASMAAFFGTLVGFAVAFISIFASMIGAVFSAINAAGATGFIDCESSSAPWPDICLGISVFNQIMDDLPSLGTTVLIAEGGIILATIIWTFEQLREIGKKV